MRLVLVRVSTPIAPFGVPASACPIGDGTLADAHVGAARRLGWDVQHIDADHRDAVDGPAVICADDTWVTARTLRQLARSARTSTGPRRLALPAGRFTSLTTPLQAVQVVQGVTAHGVDVDGVAWSCAYVPAGVRATVTEAFTAPTVVIPAREILVEMPVPRALLGATTSTTTWPLTSSIALQIRHWVHVLRASHFAPQVWLLERAERDPIRSAWRLLTGWRPDAAARADAWRRRFVFVGRNVRIHPSAIVEGSVIGDDVVIGPQAVVLQSVVGAGSRLEQRTHLNQCTLGPRTFMSLNSSMQACVTFADADACANNLQTCVIGRGAALTSFARALDTVLTTNGRPGGVVEVDDDGERRPAGELPCGIAIGPGAWLGAGVTVAAGRVVPAGTHLVAADGSVLRRTAGLGAGTYVVRDGAPHPWGPLPPSG